MAANLIWILVTREDCFGNGIFAFKGVFSSLQAMDEAAKTHINAAHEALRSYQLRNRTAAQRALQKPDADYPVELVGPDQQNRYHWESAVKRYACEDLYGFAAEVDVLLPGSLGD